MKPLLVCGVLGQERKHHWKFMAKDIYITPGTVEYEAEQRTKNHGPGYYKKKFSKK